MGIMLSTAYDQWAHPEIAPKPDTVPTFDPLYGFPEGREQKVMPMTEGEMDSAKVPIKFRDYCVDKYVVLLRCRAENFPWVASCEPQLHNYHLCEYDEYVDRMKDFERERRLKIRAKRIAEKAIAG